MAWTARGRWRTGLAAVALASLGLAAAPVPAASPASGTLYAVANGGSQLVSIDPASGVQTTIADVSTLAPGMGLGTPVADPTSNVVYADGAIAYGGGKGMFVTNQIATIDTQTGSVVLSPVLQTTLTGEMALDQATKQLWAATWCYGCFQSIVSVNPASGVVTTLATFPFLSTYPLTTLAQNAAAHKLYLAGGQYGPLNLVTFNTVTGALSTATMLTQPLGEIAIDSSSNVPLRSEGHTSE